MSRIYKKRQKNLFLTPKVFMFAGLLPAMTPLFVQNASADVTNNSVNNTNNSNSGENTDTGADNSGADNSGTDNSGADNSGTDNSGTDNSGADNSDADNSNADNSGADNSGADNSGTDNSGADNSQNNSNSKQNNPNPDDNTANNDANNRNTHPQSMPSGETTIENPKTGWDNHHDTDATTNDANNTAATAGQDAANHAKSKEDASTKAGGSTTNDSKIGWVDVYADHSQLDDAVRKATTQGVNVVHDPSVIQTGDANETADNTANAENYYNNVSNQLITTANQYTTDLANYHAQVAKNKQDAANGNNQMNALESNLAAQGQTVLLNAKQYSDTDLANDTANIKQSIEYGREYLNAKDAVANAETQQNSMTMFQSAESQGKVFLNRQDVTVANQADADNYMNNVNNSYSQLQSYLNSNLAQQGSIPDSQKPTYTLYNFTVDPGVKSRAVQPVNVYDYQPIPVAKPVQPSVNYHIYDIRSTMTSNETYDNQDGNLIQSLANQNASGNVVAQAMVHQTVGIHSDEQVLPSQRFDKIQDLTLVTKIPDNATFNHDLTDTDHGNWTVSYDPTNRTVTQTATPQYLVQVNLNQGINNSGTTGGTMDSSYHYQAPQVYFSLDKDDNTYQTHSTAIVNKEYMYVGKGIQIRTDSADPTKVNTNSHYQNIDGKAVLPGSVNNYILGWDFNQYKNVNIDDEMQQKGLRLVDDFPEQATQLTGPISIVDPANGQVLYNSSIPNTTTTNSTGTFKDNTGKTVDGFIWKVVDKQTAPDDLKDKINGQALMLQYTGADTNFYKNYVQGGHSLNVILPMMTKRLTNQGTNNSYNGYNGNSYSNVAYQSDFGNNYQTNSVTNTAPFINPSKDAVLSFANLTSLDLKNNPQSSIAKNSGFTYRLQGSTLPTNLSEPIKQYSIDDTMDTNSDEYDGNYIVQTDKPIYFQAGSTMALRYPNGLPAGSDITKYFTQTLNRNVTNGDTPINQDTNMSKITLNADSDFVSQIDTSRNELQFDAYLNAKRIANQNGVKNTFNETINDMPYTSNQVVTNSKPDPLDVLQQEIDNNKNNQDNVNKNQTDMNNKFVNALSVIVNTVNGAKAQETNDVNRLVSGVTKLNDKVDNNKAVDDQRYHDITASIKVINRSIRIMQMNSSDQLNGIASSAAAQINPQNAQNVADNTQTQTNQVLRDNSSVIQSLDSQINQTYNSIPTNIGNNSTTSTSTTIYDNNVHSDADALNWAVNNGIPANMINSINVDANGYYVIQYQQTNNQTGQGQF